MQESECAIECAVKLRDHRDVPRNAQPPYASTPVLLPSAPVRAIVAPPTRSKTRLRATQVPPGVTARHLDVQLGRESMSIGIKGNPPYLS